MVDARIGNETRANEKWDRVFRALSAEPRRQIVQSLLAAPADRALSLPEAAVPSTAVYCPEDLRRELCHSHLPLLADMGFVEWSGEPLEVSRGPQFDEVAVVFEVVESNATEFPESLQSGQHFENGYV